MTIDFHRKVLKIKFWWYAKAYFLPVTIFIWKRGQEMLFYSTEIFQIHLKTSENLYSAGMGNSQSTVHIRPVTKFQIILFVRTQQCCQWIVPVSIADL